MVKDVHIFPNARTIIILYYFFHHYMKGSYPFSKWIVIGIFMLDFVIAAMLSSFGDKIIKYAKEINK